MDDINDAIEKAIETGQKEPFLFCYCQNYARDGKPPLTNHHPRCPHYNCEKESLALIEDLIKGIENDAADTDGVSDNLWEPYKRALFYCGQLQKLKKCLDDETIHKESIKSFRKVSQLLKPDRSVEPPEYTLNWETWESLNKI